MPAAPEVLAPGAPTDVLIVGAGPTGLVLALWLARSGVRVRVVDRASGPGTTSRATVVHARTLELYRQLGIADVVIAGGIRFTAANLWAGGRPAVRVPVGEFGAGISPYPFILILPQDAHEALLVAALADAGVPVERETTFVGFAESQDGVRATLATADGTMRTCDARYLAGCDGARSAVRDALGIDLVGGTYSDTFYVADLLIDGPAANGEMHGALDDDDFLLAFPMRGAGRVRLIGRVHGGAPAARWEDVRGPAAERLGIRVREPRWFSTYRVHHRVAARFRQGRAFLLGDAAHLHSPVGGQGMNTGIGDAVNLAWKLAEVAHGRADDALLDSYEPERIAFARRLVATTDRAFAFVTARGPVASRIRTEVAPRLLPILFRSRAVRRLAFRTVSQTAIAYPESALSAGAAGRVHAGDRLPWFAYGGTDNHASLESRDWQVHVYGEAAEALGRACAARGLPLHALPWSEDARRAGLARGATYLLRPDGHVALADRDGDVGALDRYLDARALRPGIDHALT
jgi:2-polyprenyl-6-methoxyphenol hydroxylase-like FAD-dependent oxidoreductase